MLGAERTPSGGTVVRYSLVSDQTTTFRPPQPTDGLELPILATPGIVAAAAPDGTIPLSIEGERISARIVGRIDRFPSAVGEAVIANGPTAATMLETTSPGLGTTNELWANALPSPPPAGVSITSRASLLSDLRADPLARGALVTLAATAAVALALALVGLALGAVADRRDERGELFDLEAQGAAPETISGHLRLRALLVGCYGVAGGAITGAVLSALVLALVSVTASSARPEPPLRLMLNPLTLGGAVAAYALLAAVIVLAVTRTTGRTPKRREEGAT